MKVHDVHRGMHLVAGHRYSLSDNSLSDTSSTTRPIGLILGRISLVSTAIRAQP